MSYFRGADEARQCIGCFLLALILAIAGGVALLWTLNNGDTTDALWTFLFALFIGLPALMAVFGASSDFEKALVWYAEKAERERKFTAENRPSQPRTSAPMARASTVEKTIATKLPRADLPPQPFDLPRSNDLPHEHPMAQQERERAVVAGLINERYRQIKVQTGKNHMDAQSRIADVIATYHRFVRPQATPEDEAFIKVRADYLKAELSRSVSHSLKAASDQMMALAGSDEFTLIDTSTDASIYGRSIAEYLKFYLNRLCSPFICIP